MFLVGGGSTLNGLLDVAKQNFKIEVSYSNPFSRTEAPAFLDPCTRLKIAAVLPCLLFYLPAHRW